MSAYRMMVCDDDSGYRLLVKTVVGQSAVRKGREVQFLEARDGEQCVERVTAEAPDCVLLDLGMPGVSGWDALPRLRRAAPDTKIIVLSSAPQSEEPLLTALGADGFVQKPRDITVLPDLLADELCRAA